MKCGVLMHILSRVIERELEPLHEAGVQLRYIGQLDVLEPVLRRQIRHAVARTAANTEMTVCVAFNYVAVRRSSTRSGRSWRRACRRRRIDEALVSRHLYTDGLPDPDLIIRTGGQQRLSNFLIWQAAYAEYFFTPTYWPDFSQADVDEALEAYAQRVRKFGGLAARQAQSADAPGAQHG